MNNEIVGKLDRSYERRRLLPEAMESAYGRQLAGLLMVIGRVMRDAGGYAGFMSTPSRSRYNDWPEDPFAYDVAAKAVAAVIEAFRSNRKIEMPELAHSFAQATGVSIDAFARGWASGAVSAIFTDSQSGDDKEFREMVRPLLGRLAEIERQEDP